MEICEPAVLARLPYPQVENGRTLLSHVISLHSGVKRRRQEICTSVDGNSINVYEIQNGRNLSSCPIPPDSILPCPPCSLLLRSPKGKAVRYTYFATQHRNETKLSAFQEEMDGEIRKPLLRTMTLKNAEQTVAQLAFLAGADAHQVLAIRQDGHYEIYDSNLSTRMRHGKLNFGIDNGKLITALWLSRSDASKSSLKARPDILATSELDDSFVVGVFAKSHNHVAAATQEMELGIWRLRGSDKGSLSSLVLDTVLTHKFSVASPLLPMEKDPIVFVSKDTRLIVKTQSKSYTYDVSTMTLRKLQEISPIAADQLSNIYVSDALTLSSTSASLQLHNTHFRTLQTKLDLNKPGMKRKRAHATNGPIVFIAYFPTSSRAIAIRREQLLSIDLRVTVGDNFSLTSKRSSLLVNNIGRGIASQERLKISDRIAESSVGCTIRQSDQIEQWYKTTKHLERCVQERNSTEFENICLKNLNLEARTDSNQSQIVLNHKIDYMLSAIFKHNELSEDTAQSTTLNIKLGLHTPRLIKALAERGVLSADRLDKVLRTVTRTNFEPLRFGTLSQVLVDSDPSLSLLGEYLNSAPYIAYQELCEALLILLRRTIAEFQRSSIQMAPSPISESLRSEEHIDDHASLIHGEKGIDSKTSVCVSIVVERLTGVSQSRLSEYMRERFAQTELVALVQFLRQQLFRSGFTRSIQMQIGPSPPSSGDCTVNDCEAVPRAAPVITLAAIVSMLSSCMDVIGPLGVLSFGDEQDFFQTLIPDLSSEIAKATEAVQDAVFLSGVLRETLRFVESTARVQTASEPPDNEPGSQRQKSGSVITLYAEPATDGEAGQEVGLLPLSLRAENHIDATKVRKGDGRISKRSVREMGMLQDRLRGPYALERLIV